MGIRLASTIAASLLLAACGGDGDAWQTADANRQAPDPITKFAADDPAMEAAKRKGRATLPAFLSRFAAPASGEGDFGVKYDLVEGDAAEFIWADIVRRDGDTIVATLANAPAAPGFRLGEQVRIPVAEVVDWSYRKGSRMEGHFTTRVIMDRMPEAEAASIRTALGW